MSIQKAKQYHMKKEQIPQVVESTIGREEVIYGARAINARVPGWLDKHTTDYDVFSPTPRKDALQTERALDTHMGGDHFVTEKAQHEGTWKVRSKQTGEGVADFTKPEGRMPASDWIGGKRYVKLSWMKQRAKKVLKQPEFKYRHAKDKDAIDRINIYERTEGKGENRIKRIARMIG